MNAFVECLLFFYITNGDNLENMKKGDKKLVLFDIDGTLINPGDGAKVSLSKTIFNNFGVEVKVTYENTAGKTDRWIMKDILISAGIDEKYINGKMDKVINDYISFMKVEYNKNNDARIFDGVEVLLEKLIGFDNVILGLLTGNIEPGARIKLSPFNLNKYFPFGAFGNEGFYREELVETALKKAKNLYGITFYGKNIVIIGDTVNDVICGKKYDAKSIAVVMRPEYLERVKDAKPDFLFTGFQNTDIILDAILL